MKKTSVLAFLIITAVIQHVSAQELDLEFEKIQVGLDGGDINKIPVREDPGPDAEVILQTVHEKEILVPRKDLSFKWTTLGYGARTHKVIVPQLAAHTLFNHRNPGEDGPCLRSNRRSFGGNFEPLPIFGELPVSPQPKPDPVVDTRGEISISITVSNEYLINREKNICKVRMVEDVRTTIEGEEFYHVYRKDMGFRFIADCPEAV